MAQKRFRIARLSLRPVKACGVCCIDVGMEYFIIKTQEELNELKEEIFAMKLGVCELI